MKNWKTTAASALTAALYAAANGFTNGQVNWKQLAIAGGIAAIGVLAKDLNVTGGTVPQQP